MKKCPFCAEQIQYGAVFCKHCRKDLPPTPQTQAPVSNSQGKPFTWLKWLSVVCIALVMIPPVLIGVLQGLGVDTTASSTSQVSSADVPHYEVVQTINGHRFDGAAEYYVQMDPVDLSNDIFKKDVELIISDVVTKNGAAISIEIHDNKESLNLSHQQYGDLSLKRVLTDAEKSLLGEHFIASFEGQMSTGVYTNTLSFFPGAIASEEVVGKYVETIQFNPAKVVVVKESGPNGEYGDPDICDINSYVAGAVIQGYAKYPDEAKQSCSYATLTSLGNHEYEVSGYVLAKNSFGVEGRLSYKIKMRYKGGRTTDLKNWENLGEPEITQ